MSAVENVAKIFQEQILNKLQNRLVEEGCSETKVKKVFEEFSYSSPNVYTPKPKPYKVENMGKRVVLVLDYGDSSHAIFGDFRVAYKDFKDGFLTKKNFTRFNKNLAFGAGWILTDKSKLTKLEDGLKEYGIEYDKLTRTEYEKKIKKEKGLEDKKTEEPSESSDEEDLADSSDEEDSSSPVKETKKKETKKETSKKKEKEPEEEEAPKKKEKESVKEKETKKKEAPKKGKETKKKEKEPEEEEETPKKKGGKPKKNDWGNLQEPVTGFIFKVLPIEGKNKPVAIGVQDTNANKKEDRGLESVYRLTKKDIKTCKEYGWKYLTQEIIDEIKEEGSKKSKALAKTLQEIIVQDADDKNTEESDDEGPEDGDESETEDEAVYYNISVPCTSGDTEDDEEFEIDIPCKFKSKEVLKKVKNTLKNEEDEDEEFEKLKNKLDGWLENVEDTPYVSDTPKIGDKLTGKEDEDFLVFK